jgi:hypothetical protein
MYMVCLCTAALAGHWVPNHNNVRVVVDVEGDSMVMVFTGMFPLSLRHLRTDFCGCSFFVDISISGFHPPLHLPAPFSMKGGLLLAHALNSAHFHFAGVILFGGIGVGLGMGFSIDDGLLVPRNAHLHHAGVLCMPQLWLL